MTVPVSVPASFVSAEASPTKASMAALRTAAATTNFVRDLTLKSLRI
jgi:hypothetical protein